MTGQAVPKKRQDLIIGMDFGTTHTAISFAMTRNKRPHNVSVWPDSKGRPVNARKAPTRFVYKGDDTPQLWGYQVGSHPNMCAWMKYHLDRDSPITRFDDPDLVEAMKSGLLSLPEPKTAEDVAVDYLSEVFKFAISHIKEALYGNSILYFTAVKWWLAKPAIWGAGAELRLESIVANAAKCFGGARENDEFNFIKEPEAAAISLFGYEEDQPKKNTVFLVCDCGGGTVDVAAYKVVSPPPYVEFEEVVTGQGGKCGSAYVDRLFQELMEKRFGDSYRSVGREAKATGSKFMDTFEAYKQCFKDGADIYPMRLPLEMANLPDSVSSDHYHRRDKEVLLSEDDMKGIFQRVVDTIIKMIAEQERAARRKNANVTELWLVGGFGWSPYLQARIREWCNSDSRDIKLRLPKQRQDSWGAVSHGAVLRGLEKVKIEKRITRFHYGIPCMLDFNRRLDPPSDHYLSPFNIHYAKNCVLWFIKAGTIITDDTKNSERLSREVMKGEKGFTIKIVSCKEDPAPRKHTKAVQNVGSLRVDISEVDTGRFESMEVPDKGTIIKFDFTILQTKGTSEGSLLFKAFTLDNRALGVSSDIKLSAPEPRLAGAVA